jgi:predicted nucleic acid-binding Zn finger protein
MSLDEIRLLANVNTRAKSLFADGYRAGWLEDHRLEVLTPAGETYEIDVVSGSCTCPFYAKHAGKHGCKHLLGYKKLLNEQEALA